ncbi:hypothetical protein NVS89_22645 [Ancylobacter sp. MQZ15Z-1]|uniref:Uncharacterized protein n=1 Tax=Ancylobacter mangrovi TaxID=2972472 RepID=A0A9X2PFT7_9HYPH|nr:hypothetical protein [Ancylobacter mangrovi]MCS0497894.1 hypothetical protein [Ancylobacter mangrovi]
MAPFPTDLASALECLVQTERAAVTESAGNLTVARLGAVDATAIVEAVAALGWTYVIEDATPEVINREQISPGFEPYRLVVTKPARPEGTAMALTRSGLTDWLLDDKRPPVIWVAGLPSAFETKANRIAPWGDETVFVPMATGCDPRKVVRELAPERLVTAQIDHWLVRDPDLDWPVTHWAFVAWAKYAFPGLLRCLSDEVEEDGTLLFRGPPLSRLKPEADLIGALSPQGMRAVQRAASWVFESSVEMRPRHDLFAPEIARTAHSGQGAGAMFLLAAESALEGAIMARAFGLSEVSRDSLKAMTELRKAVSEEIGKLSDTTRSIASAVAAALFAGIALIAGRLALDNPALIVRQAVAVIGVVLFLYVAAIVASGLHYVGLQRRLRREWHAKIYRFMPESDYETMVVGPAASAEGGFYLAAWIGGIAATLLLVLVVCTALARPSGLPYQQGTEEPATKAAEVPEGASVNSKAGDVPASAGAGTDTQSAQPKMPEKNL